MKTCPTCHVSYQKNFNVCPDDGSPLEEIETWTVGNIIRDKYRLLAKVGQGGMGSVYKAQHLAFDEMRALKVIAPELLTDESFVKRFTREAVRTRKLQHPNAVRVDDIDQAEDGRPFIVMEFIEGKSLKKLIREEGPLPYSRVFSIIKQCANALDAAHKLGMVHRDIKPDNIALVDAPEGEMVKVLDFGIAKVKEESSGEDANLTLTGVGVVIGTPQYMSPEQAMGKRGDELDGRADLYSLGVVMYQMLTADLPFKADSTMGLLLAHMQKPPAPIEVLHPEIQVPASVRDLTMRLLEKDRDLRPASARALVQEIERAEQELLNPGKTRVLTADDLIRPSDTRTATGVSRAATGVAPVLRPQASPPAPQLRPAEPARPAPPLRAAMPSLPPQPLPPPRPAAPESHWGMWAALIVLLVGIGGGGLYIATRQPSTPPAVGGDLAATLTAEPSTIQKGQAVTLRWTSQNATDLDLEPGVGKVNKTTGYTSVTPDDSITYTLTASGPAGTQSASAHVNVTASAPPSAGGSGPDKTPEPTTDTNNRRHKTKPLQQTETPVAVSSPPAHPAVDVASVKGKLNLGIFHFKRGEYDDAITNFQEGLKLDPPNAELHEDLDKAIKACKAENATVGAHFNCGGQ